MSDSLDTRTPENLDEAGKLFEEHRPRLGRMIAVRIDSRLRGRVEPEDLMQEVFVEATERLEYFLDKRPMPFFLWLRFLAGQKLDQAHRFHLGTQKRDAGKEIRMQVGGCPEASSIVLADAIAASRQLTPSRETSRKEQQERLVQVLDSLQPHDREVLLMRHFEELTNAETAEILGLSAPGASLRYVRATARLKEALASWDPPSML